MLTNLEFDQILRDRSKCIVSNIVWEDDEDHSPAVEFRVDVENASGHPLFMRGSFNSFVDALTYALIHKGHGRIYALDLGKDHHNPSCERVGEKHKHRWDDRLRDKQAYVPNDITHPATDPVYVWKQFCREANIKHLGKMSPPPARQSILL